MTSVYEKSEAVSSVAEAQEVTLFLGRIGSNAVEHDFAEYPVGGEGSLAVLIERIMDQPEDDNDGYVLWLRQPEEEAKLEDIVLAGGQVVINQTERELVVDDVPQVLENKQFAVLQLLASEKGRIFRKEEIVERCWGTRYITEGVVKVNIAGLRKALGEHRGLIITAFGIGYVLDERPSDAND